MLCIELTSANIHAIRSMEKYLSRFASFFFFALRFLLSYTAGAVAMFIFNQLGQIHAMEIVWAVNVSEKLDLCE